jgi:hypothetical protein
MLIESTENGIAVPRTKTGDKILKKMKKAYGKKKGKKVFYSSINKKKPGAKKWHKAKK